MCSLGDLQTWASIDDLADMHEAMDLQDELRARVDEWHRDNPPERE